MSAKQHESSTAEMIKPDFTFSRGEVTVTVKNMATVPGGIRFDLSVTRAGLDVPQNNPHIVINPPLLVPDINGDITLRDRRDVEYKYILDPDRALQEIIMSGIE